MCTIRKMLSELYHTCTTEEKEVFTKYLSNLENIVEKYLIDGYDILYIAFSSMLSGTYNSALIAKDELIDKYPNCNIEIIDTKSASGGHGLLVYTAVQLKLEGKTITEIVDAIEKLKKRLYCYFTVKDLKHLERGGRISSAAAMVGSILNITPILEVKNDGTLDTVGKIRGEKKAIKELINKKNPKSFTATLIKSSKEPPPLPMIITST